MASTNKTTNYELSQFEGTDKPSWEADYNADMLIIDTNMKAISDVANGASGSIPTLADRVTTAEGNISTNANDIDALEARADALEAGETTADGRLDALEAEQIIQNTAIEGNTQLAYNIARPYDSASTYAINDYSLFQNTLYKCTTAITTGEAFDPDKWEAIKVMDEIADKEIIINDAFTLDIFGVGEMTPAGVYTFHNTGLSPSITRNIARIKITGNLAIIQFRVAISLTSFNLTSDVLKLLYVAASFNITNLTLKNLILKSYENNSAWLVANNAGTNTDIGFNSAFEITSDATKYKFTKSYFTNQNTSPESFSVDDLVICHI